MIAIHIYTFLLCNLTVAFPNNVMVAWSQFVYLSKWTFPSYTFVSRVFFPLETTVGSCDAEIKVPSGENTELKRSPFKVWSRSVYSHTCYAYCQECLPCLFLPFRSIHLHFFQNLSQFFPVVAVANTGSCVGPQNKIGHPVECRFPCWVPAEYKLAKNMTCGMMTSEMNDLDIEWSLCSALMSSFVVDWAQSIN